MSDILNSVLCITWGGLSLLSFATGKVDRGIICLILANTYIL